MATSKSKAQPLIFKDPWGWSKLDVYRTCPQQFKFKFMDKLREQESEALRKGNMIHKALESWLNGWTPQIVGFTPSEAWMVRLKALKALKPRTEAAWGITRQWQPLENWFDANTWVRAKSDAYYQKGNALTLIDFKSGKYRIPSKDQVELYALIGHCFFPDVKMVLAQFWFLEQESVPHKEVYSVSRLMGLRAKYELESAKLYNDRKFQPTPGEHCRYCSFSRQKGGTCQY